MLSVIYVTRSGLRSGCILPTVRGAGKHGSRPGVGAG